MNTINFNDDAFFYEFLNAQRQLLKYENIPTSLPKKLQRAQGFLEETLQKKPCNPVQLARVCRKTDQIIIRLLRGWKVDDQSLLNTLKQTRKRMGRLLVRDQRMNNLWKGFKWRGPKETLRNVKRVLIARLGLSSQEIKPHSDRWFKDRELLLQLSARDFQNFGLSSAISENRWFTSYIDILIEIFDEKYNIKEELIQKSRNNNLIS